MKQLLLCSVLLLMVAFCSGQAIEETNSQRKISLSLQTGILTITNPYFGSLNDFQRMVPESEL